MDHSHLSPHFDALDIILGYLNRGNSAPEIKYISSVAKAWCRQYHRSLLEHTPASLNEVLWTHPFLFDLSIRSFARLFSFNDCGRNHSARNTFARNSLTLTQNTKLSQTNTSPSPLPHIRPPITAQHFFSAMIDAYTLYVGGNGRWFHDRIVARDLKTSPIIHHIPEVIHRIAALDIRELLTTEFSTFSPKTSLGFSCHLAKAVDIVMMDAPPVDAIENDTLEALMDIDSGYDTTQEAPASRNVSANNSTRASARSSKRKSAAKGIKRCRSRSGRSRRRHSWSVRKKRKQKY